MSDRLNKLLECRRKNQLPEYREQLQYLDDEENVLLDLYLRRVALGEIQEDITGYPSLDKIWLKYYQEEYIRADIPYMTIIEYLKESNKNNMKQIAINPLENKGILTYEELFQIIDKVASSLDSLEIYKGDVIMGILPSVTAHEVYLLYAADIVGAAVNFMPEGTVVSDICHQINQFNVDYLFITDNSLGVEMEEELYSKTQLKAIIVVGTKNEKHRKQNTITWQKFMDLGTGRKVPEINRNPEDLLFIAKTGGTTGEPKNVLLNDNCFNIMVHQYLHSDLNYNTGDKWLRLWSLFSASAAISSSHLALCAGMENILRAFPDSKDFDKLIIKEKPNHLMLIPVLLDWLEKSELLFSEDLSFIKSIGIGGVSITEEFERRIERFLVKHNIPIYLGYGWGCTENSSSASMRMNSETTIIGCIGVPLVKTVVGVFNPDNNSELGYDQEGEMCIRSLTPMIGYYNDSELTKKVLKRHNDGLMWIHTGDLGTISKEGIVSINGRITRTIFTYTGAKIYPAQMEGLIANIPGVEEIVVVGLTDTEHESFEIPFCIVVSDKQYKTDTIRQEINSLCYKNYPPELVPKHIRFRDSIPLTSSGKPDIMALIKELQSSELRIED